MTTRHLPTLAEREARRAEYVRRAVARARFAEMSLTCVDQHADGPPFTPTTCLGLRANGFRFGCLCPCHDALLGEVVQSQEVTVPT